MMDADLERDSEEQLETDGRADDLGEVGRTDGKLGQQPQGPRDPSGVGVAARLSQIAAGRDRQSRAQRLEQDRHAVGKQCYEQQRVGELCATGERGRPVAGVHVTDGDEVAGAEECDGLAPRRPRSGNRNCTVHIR